MNTQKGLTPIVVLVIIISALMLSSAVYFGAKNFPRVLLTPPPTTTDHGVKAFPSKEACEKATGKVCGDVMCDYVPPGKTFEEVCGRNFRKGWQPRNSSLEIDTLGWKTYRNEDFGFEAKYPSTWHVRTLINNTVENIFSVSFDKLNQAGEPNASIYFMLQRNENLKKLPIDKWYADQKRGIQPKINTTIGSRKAILMEEGTYGSKYYLVSVNETGILTISYFSNPEFDEVYKVILSTFRFIEPNISKLGILSGKVSIGPFCPVERVGVPCPTPPEAYTSREVVVYALDGKTVITRKHFNPDGTYRFELSPRQYVLVVPQTGIGGSKDLPKTITIKAGETTVFDVSIDTGIR